MNSKIETELKLLNGQMIEAKKLRDLKRTEMIEAKKLCDLKRAEMIEEKKLYTKKQTDTVDAIKSYMYIKEKFISLKKQEK